jgi:chromosome segregation ATPase
MAYDYNKLVEDLTNTLKEVLDGPWVSNAGSGEVPERPSNMMAAMQRANTELQKTVNSLTEELTGVLLENTNLKKQNTGLQHALLESQNDRRELKMSNGRLKNALKSIKSSISYIKDEELA